MMSQNASVVETVLDLSRNRYRRVVLAVLADEQRSLTLNDLTKTVVKHAHDAPVTEVSNDVLTRIQILLHHVHLPKVADAGFATYDWERKQVEPTERIDQAQPQIATLVETDPELEAPLEL